MASSLISNTNSRQQYQANLLTNRPNLIKVIVEDEEDIVVWHKILSQWHPDKQFEISPFFTDPSIANSKGKAHILTMSAQFGPYFLGCVDSDYDYLLEDHTADGQTIKNNPYILQTFCYSIENLACQPYGISAKLQECKRHSCELQRNADADLSLFISEISKALYPVLLWQLTLKKEDRQEIDWNEVLGNDNYRPIINDNTLSLPQKRTEILKIVNTLSAQAEARLATSASDLTNDRTSLEARLSSTYGLTPENAYLFVRGHNLYDFLHFTFFSPIEETLRKEHNRDIAAYFPPQEIPNALNHYKRLIKDFRNEQIIACGYLGDRRNHITALLENSVKALTF